MKLLSFQVESGRLITDFGSDFVHQLVTRFEGEAAVSLVHLPPGGTIGMHEARVPQLMIVCCGSAEVCGSNSRFSSVKAGDAAFWTTGERHETISDEGMTALILESPVLKEQDFKL
ncbi:cupin domain-containing protein [Alkalicoccus luteus]|uniref:Cupin n=1 Tax=Alkalicoccus luteus TaxID=1237094 RepID=A0A969TUN1_9BACI|nr:cupin [Alkalicoccus luteus]NJP37510.1 cupin [Alkalicoccus luteus]